MKFGAQIKSKSVPEWKSYNIDYNQLKFKIRITTENRSKPNNERLKKDLYNEFIEQIDMVNLFLNSKIGEVKRRIIYIENAIEQQHQQHFTQPHNHEEFEFDIEQYLYKISADLQKLSRFIVIQKTGLRKLLKKYTKYSMDNGELNIKINKYMINNNQSFIHIDLTGLFLELALIYDLIRADLESSISPSNSPNTTMNNTNNSNNNNTHKRRTSYMDPALILNKNEYFDFESSKEGNYTEKFLVHYDNLQELKLFLLANFYLVDQNVSATRQNIELKKQTSTLSLRQIIGRSTSNEDLPIIKQSDDEQQQQQQNEDEESKQIYRSNSIYLNESDELVADSTTSSLILEDPRDFSSIKNESEPGMFLTDLQNTKRTMLLSAIGGFRKVSCVLLNDDVFLQDLLESCSQNEPYSDFYQRNESKLTPLSSLEKISIEWIYSKNVKPLIKVKSNKTRFTNLNAMKTITKDSKFKSWISLKSNIKISNVDLATNQWTEANENDESNSTQFPYAILEVRWNLPNTIPVLEKLFESHLIYNIDKSFNTLTYSLYKFNKLSFKPNWAQLFENHIDIRKLPPKLKRRKQSKANLSITSNTALPPSITNINNNNNNNNTDNNSSLHNPSVSGESTVQFRYWNEFDNGSDFEQDNAFMVDIDFSDDHNLLNNASIDWFYKVSKKFHDFIIVKLPWLLTDDEHESLINNNDNGFNPNDHRQTMQHSGYGSLESDVESMNEQIKTHQQSTFLSSLSLLSALFALLLTAVSLGITASIFNSYEDVNLSPVIIGILTITMLFSLFLGILAICLIMSCEKKPLGNLIFVWSVFLGVTFFIIGGIGSVFGI